MAVQRNKAQRIARGVFFALGFSIQTFLAIVFALIGVIFTCTVLFTISETKEYYIKFNKQLSKLSEENGNSNTTT